MRCIRNAIISGFIFMTLLETLFCDAFREAKFKRSTDQACFHKPNSGMCLALFINWYYNSTEDTCNKFVYGGCGGNDNNFRTGEECVSTCGGTVVESDSNFAPVFPPDPDDFLGGNEGRCDSNVEPGSCGENITRYYFDGQKCETFDYSGCLGNNNNFETEEDCLRACGHSISTRKKNMLRRTGILFVVALFHVTFVDLLRIQRSAIPEDLCQLPPLTGMCRALFRMYYYNASSNTCQQFVYGGCGGNENRFWTSDACVDACGGTIVENGELPSFYGDYEFDDINPCYDDLEYGNCDDFILRFYYDGEKCSPFQWSGCGESSNNFKTEEDCLRDCTNGTQDSMNEI